jgi:DHA3 family macrolide efflux protein-like MFS transporter
MEINWKKNTALFLTGQALSIFGSMAVQYAIIWHITLKTQSGAMMTVFTVAGFLPRFFISPFAGVWADRFNRKYLINISDGVIAFASLIVAVLFSFGFEHGGILLLCAGVRSFGQGVQNPAVGAFLPQIVPKEHQTRINGLQGGIDSFITLAAPAASGILITLASLEILFFLDVITAAIGISILFFFVKAPALKKSEPAQEQTKPAYFHDLKEGVKYIAEHKYILQQIIISAALLMSLAPSPLLTSLHAARGFGDDVWRLTAIQVAMSVGMMAGGIVIGAWGGFKNRVFTLTFACVLLGLEVVGLGLSKNFVLYIGIMAVMGLTMPMYGASAMTLLQSTVEPAFMGRVISVYGMVSGTMFPLGMLIFGPISDTVSLDFIFIGTGVVVALLSIPFITSKALREAGKLLAVNKLSE